MEAEEAGARRHWWTAARQGYSGGTAGLERTGGSGLGDPNLAGGRVELGQRERDLALELGGRSRRSAHGAEWDLAGVPATRREAGEADEVPYGRR